MPVLLVWHLRAMKILEKAVTFSLSMGVLASGKIGKIKGSWWQIFFWSFDEIYPKQESMGRKSITSQF